MDQTKWGAGSTGYNLLGIDAEPDGSDDEDGADDEPSLGSNTTIAASYFFQRSRDGSLDCEGDEHDGQEPEADEPSLGSTSANMNKGGSGAGDGGNLEQGTTPAVVIGRRAPRRDNR